MLGGLVTRDKVVRPKKEKGGAVVERKADTFQWGNQTTGKDHGGKGYI